MLTQTDITKLIAALKGSFATKEDLKTELAKYATKEDLKTELARELAKYATKEDLKTELARELAKYATKEDLKQTEKRILEMEKHILEGMADYISETLTPYLDRQENRIGKLEKHTSHPPIRPSL